MRFLTLELFSCPRRVAKEEGGAPLLMRGIAILTTAAVAVATVKRMKFGVTCRPFLPWIGAPT